MQEALQQQPKWDTACSLESNGTALGTVSTGFPVAVGHLQLCRRCDRYAIDVLLHAEKERHVSTHRHSQVAAPAAADGGTELRAHVHSSIPMLAGCCLVLHQCTPQASARLRLVASDTTVSA
jgi:hypothetical protein